MENIVWPKGIKIGDDKTYKIIKKFTSFPYYKFDSSLSREEKIQKDIEWNANSKIYIMNTDSFADESSQEVKELANSHLTALDFAFSNARDNHKLDNSFIKDINYYLFKETDHYGIDGIGFYRNCTDNQVEGCSWKPSPSWRVAQDMDNLIYKYDNEWQNLHPIERACLLHVELIKIHPFGDGNGRTARILLSYELIKNGYPAVVIKSNNKENYCKALNKAIESGDCSDFANLIKDAVEFRCNKYIEKFSEDFERK